MPEGVCKQIVPEETTMPETKVRVQTLVKINEHNYNVEVETEDSPYVLPDMIKTLDEILHGEK